ncbi:hypothetical protein D1007_21443 [Hordeum vulgare]|nr:hypothetical protein D1007_21443 [Hordeum vulgare]
MCSMWMLSSSDKTHDSGNVSSSESDNTMSPADGEGSSNLECDRGATIILPASKIPGRFYRNPKPRDILSDALETKEPPGRAGGICVNVPHKRAFTLSKEERIIMKKARSEMKYNKMYEELRNAMYQPVQKETKESMTMQKTLAPRDSQ